MFSLKISDEWDDSLSRPFYRLYDHNNTCIKEWDAKDIISWTGEYSRLGEDMCCYCGHEEWQHWGSAPYTMVGCVPNCGCDGFTDWNDFITDINSGIMTIR